MKLAPQWSLKWKSPPRGLALARESGQLLFWDDHQWLTLLNRAGEVQSQHHRSAKILGAGIADDGSAIVAIDAENRLVLLGTDLKPLWDRQLSKKLGAVAIDPLAKHLAVAEATGRIRLIDGDGQLLSDFTSPRPPQYLVFEPATTRLLVAGDFGFVACLDLLTGEWLWRDSPVIHHGGLAVTGTGNLAMLACFTEGLRVYDAGGKIVTLAEKLPACKSVATAFDARLIVTIGWHNTLLGFGSTGKQRFEQKGEHPWLAVAVGGLGEVVIAASAEPRLTAWSVVE